LDVSIDALVFGDEDKPNGLRFDDFIMFSKLFDETELENAIEKIGKILTLLRANKKK